MSHALGRWLIAGASLAAILTGTAMSLPANAASLPSCANNVSCTNNTTFGEAGYYGSDDNHTHYRFTETTVTASASLKNLNGLTQTSPDNEGAVGTELCDPNTGDVAQIGLFWDYTTSSYRVAYAEGTFSSLTAEDPCIDDGFENPAIESADTLLGNFTINQGDKVYVGVYYSPSRHHYLEFGACDITQDVCRQAQVSTGSQEYWEFGTGALTNNGTLTAPASNLLAAFTGSEVTTYSGKGPISISDVAGYNGLGGLTEAQFDNASSQVVMSPNDSLSGSTFSLFEGSTSA
jgi:hypothetical protein